MTDNEIQDLINEFKGNIIPIPQSASILPVLGHSIGLQVSLSLNQNIWHSFWSSLYNSFGFQTEKLLENHLKIDL